MRMQARRRYRITVDQFLKIGAAGILPDDDRFELIEGDILVMARPGPPHNALVARANRFFVTALGEDAVIYVQTTIKVGEYTAPQPDVVVLKPRDDFYGDRLAEPDDVLLLIEVSDSSLSFDRNRKRRLYQEAGVRDYWIVNVGKRVIEVYRGSDPTRIVRRGETITPLALPELVVRADTLLG